MKAQPPVVNLRRPTPSPSPHTSPNGPPSLPISIVSQEIVPYLAFSDAVSVSLLSRHVYSTIPPRLVHVVCRDVDQLKHLFQYLTSSMQSQQNEDPSNSYYDRSSRLESLIIERSVFLASSPVVVQVVQMVLTAAKSLRLLAIGNPELQNQELQRYWCLRDLVNVVPTATRLLTLRTNFLDKDLKTVPGALFPPHTRGIVAYVSKLILSDIFV